MDNKEKEQLEHAFKAFLCTITLAPIAFMYTGFVVMYMFNNLVAPTFNLGHIGWVASMCLCLFVDFLTYTIPSKEYASLSAFSRFGQSVFVSTVSLLISLILTMFI